MQNLRTGIQAHWLKALVMIAIASSYLLYAPNYHWVAKTSNPAYGADFLQEWVGARMILCGHASQLYNVETFRAWQYDPSVVGFEWQTDQYFPPVYPPPHYVLFLPFATIEYRWATVIWLFVLIAAIVPTASCIAHLSKVSNSQAQTRYLWIAMLLFPSLLFSITLGQKSVLWLLAVCWTWRFLQANHDFKAGLVFGLVSLKPTLFFLIPIVMLFQRRWSFLLGVSSSVTVLWGSAALVVPWESWVAFGQSLLSAGQYAEHGGYRLDWSCNLMALAYGVPASWMPLCKLGVCLPLAIYVSYAAIGDKAWALVTPEKAMLLLCATVLISPHSYHYDLCVLLLPILWMAAESPRVGGAYYALLALGVTIAPEALECLQIPIVPVVLAGLICELRLRPLLSKSASSWLSPKLEI
jgi:hypothetical protein